MKCAGELSLLTESISVLQLVQCSSVVLTAQPQHSAQPRQNKPNPAIAANIPVHTPLALLTYSYITVTGTYHYSYDDRGPICINPELKYIFNIVTLLQSHHHIDKVGSKFGSKLKYTRYRLCFIMCGHPVRPMIIYTRQ